MPEHGTVTTKARGGLGTIQTSWARRVIKIMAVDSCGLRLGMISRKDIMKMTNRRHYLGRRFEKPLIVDGMTITKDDTESLLNIIVRLKYRLITMMKRYCM